MLGLLTYIGSVVFVGSVDLHVRWSVGFVGSVCRFTLGLLGFVESLLGLLTCIGLLCLLGLLTTDVQPKTPFGHKCPIIRF